MRVHISDSACLQILRDDLRRGGCAPSKLDDETLEVRHPNAEDAGEARTELVFFLRAWQARHPNVELTLV